MNLLCGMIMIILCFMKCLIQKPVLLAKIYVKVHFSITSYTSYRHHLTMLTEDCIRPLCTYMYDFGIEKRYVAYDGYVPDEITIKMVPHGLK